MAENVLKEKKRFLKRLVPLLEAGGCYGEALYIHTSSRGIHKDTTSIEVRRNADEGVKLRVYDGLQYHEHGVSGWNERAFKKVARELGRVKVKRGKDVVTLEHDERPLDADFKAHGDVDAREVPVKEQIKTVEALQATLMQSSSQLVDARAYNDNFVEQRAFVNRYRALSQEVHGTLVILVAFVKTKTGDTRYHYQSWFDHGYERTRISPAEIKKVARFAEKIARAEKLPHGKYQCLLSPELSGLLAHESFGHGMEADTIYKGRAKAGEWLGKKLAPKSVSIADGPLSKGAHGFFFFDDEGFLATEAMMINKGVVEQPLTDAYHAARLKVARTSNARCESFDHKTYARMTNTYFKPGTRTKKELLAKVKDGLYLHTSSGGMEDPKGWGIQIQGVTAERIKNGKLTGKLYYEAGMTGYLPTLLNNIKGVSKEFAIRGTGRCGKGHHDWVRVAEGGPHLLIKDVILS